jgi:hypothetical protein
VTKNVNRLWIVTVILALSALTVNAQMVLSQPPVRNENGTTLQFTAKDKNIVVQTTITLNGGLTLRPNPKGVLSNIIWSKSHQACGFNFRTATKTNFIVLVSFFEGSFCVDLNADKKIYRRLGLSSDYSPLIYLSGIDKDFLTIQTRVLGNESKPDTTVQIKNDIIGVE